MNKSFIIVLIVGIFLTSVRSQEQPCINKDLHDVVCEIHELVRRPPPCCAPQCQSCSKLYADGERENGAYELSNTQVYCHMDPIPGCGSGGFTLVMKIDGYERTFLYDDPLWTNTDAYNIDGGSTGFDSQETKLPTYWQTPFTKVCLGMRVGGETRFISLNKTAASLHSLIADGQYRATSLGRNAWKSLLSGSSLQPNCNKEGFNAEGEGTGAGAKARIGITANEQDDCDTNDSRIGFGTGGGTDLSASCGNIAKYGGDNGDKHIKAMGYILVQ